MREKRFAVWLALGYVALTIVCTYPLSIRPGDHVMSQDTDTNLYIWTLAWDTHAFVHQPFSIFDANIFYPLRHTLAYSENLIGSAFFAAPVLWLTHNPVLAMNLAALITAPLCAFGAYFLGRSVGLGVAGSALVGLIYGFSPPRFFRLDQLHLTNVQWIPFALASAHRYLDDGRRRDLWLAIAFFTLQALTSGHGAVFLTLVLLALVVYRVALGEPAAVARRVRDVGLVGALLLLPAMLILLPYRTVQVEMGLRRTLENWYVPWTSFLASPSRVQQYLVAHFLPDAKVYETAGAYLFPGYIPLSLGAIGIVWRSGRGVAWRRAALVLNIRSWRNDMASFYTLILILSVWLSMGPPYGLWQYVYWLPGLNFVRAPSRFMILGVLALAALAGFGFERLSARLSASRRTALASALAALMVIEFAGMPLDITAQRPDLPAVDRWLATRPAPFSVAEVPVPDSANLTVRQWQQSVYILHSMAHWQKTVHGYSGLVPEFSENLYWQLTKFPDRSSLQTLLDIGVTYLVVHPDLYPPADWPRIDAAIGRLAELKLEHAEADGRVYSLHRRSVQEMGKAGFGSAAIEDLVRAKDHGLINRARARGFATTDPDELARLKDRSLCRN